MGSSARLPLLVLWQDCFAAARVRPSYLAKVL